MKISRFVILLVIVTFACSEPTKKTPSGLEYNLVRKGDGVLPKVDQIVALNYKVIDSKDSVWVDTYDRGFPEVVPIQDSSRIESEDGITQMVRMLSKGDSTKFKMSVVKFFKDFVGRPLPPTIDSTLDLNYYLTVEKIMDRDSFEAFRTEAIEKYQVVMEAKKKDQLAKDTKAIDEYLEKNNIDAKKTDSGLRYVVTKEGEGPTAQSGQSTTIDYSGYLLDGTFFDTSSKAIAQEKGVYNELREPYEPIEVTIDESSVIAGWHEILKLMSKGSEVTVYIPSSLGYGPQQRSEVIKANSILVFDMKLIDIKDKAPAVEEEGGSN